MKLEFAATDKKINSTKIISSYSKTLTGARFKEESNLTRPIFMIGTSSISFTTYNYVKVTFDNDAVKYYFIDKFEIGTDQCWYIYCTMDVLATYKSDILSKSLYVLRSASEHNENIIDTYYPQTSEYRHQGPGTIGNYVTVNATDYISHETITEDIPSYQYFNHKTFLGGYVYVKVLQKGYAVDSPGATQTYVMTYSMYETFINKIFTIDYSGGFPDIAEGIARGVANVFQYITEVFWLPVKSPAITLGSCNIHLGVYEIELDDDAALIEYPSNINVQFFISEQYRHPQSSRGNYLNCSPYTLRTLTFYPFGVYDLSDSLAAANDSTLYRINLIIDEVTGQTIIEISKVYETSMYNNVIVRDVKDYKVTIPIVEASQTLLAGLGGVINKTSLGVTAGTAVGIAAGMALPGLGIAGWGAVAGGLIAGGTTSATLDAASLISGKQNLGIGNALIGAGTEVHTAGTLGAITPYGITPKLESEFCIIADADYDHDGYPLCEIMELGDLSGFTICKVNDIGISAASQDQLTMIRNYLTTGFYIE